MADLNELITRAIADFDNVQEAIEESGVPVPYDTDTSEYGNLVREAVEKNKQSGGGEDGFSPIAIVEQTESGATITITDKNGTTTATVTNGKDGKDGKDSPIQEWQPNKEYQVGDIVVDTRINGYGDFKNPVQMTFICTETHTSEDFVVEVLECVYWKSLYPIGAVSTSYVITNNGEFISGQQIAENIENVGIIATALEEIIAIQEELMGVSE